MKNTLFGAPSRRILFSEEDSTSNLVSLLAETRLQRDSLNESFESAASAVKSHDRKENVPQQGSNGKAQGHNDQRSMLFGRLSTNSDKRYLLGGSPRRVERTDDTPRSQRRSVFGDKYVFASEERSVTDPESSESKVFRRLIRTPMIQEALSSPPLSKGTRTPILTPSSSVSSTDLQLPQFSESSSRRSTTSPVFSLDRSTLSAYSDEPTSERDFQYLHVLGKGSFGKVLLARRPPLDEIVAVKVLDRKKLLERGNLRRAHCEIRCLEKCDSANFIVRLKAAFESRSKIFIVQEACMGGELFSVLSRYGKLSPASTRFYTAQCALALEHLHRIRYAYRDLKTENIMLDRNGNVRIVDFGLVKEGVILPDRGGRSFVGTTEYLAPEMILRKGHGFAVDWWALGIVIFELLTGLPPWYTNNALEMQRRVVYDPLSLSSEYVTEDARLTISALLDKSPLRRMGSKDGIKSIKSSPFFRDLDWDALEQKQIPAPFLPVLDHDADVKYFSDEFLQMSVEL